MRKSFLPAYQDSLFLSLRMKAHLRPPGLEQPFKKMLLAGKGFEISIAETSIELRSKACAEGLGFNPMCLQVSLLSETLENFWHSVLRELSKEDQWFDLVFCLCFYFGCAALC